MNVAVWVERHGRRRPDDPALADGDRVHAGWGAFAARTAGAAAGLRGDLGLSPGNRVAIVMRNRPEYLEALFAIWHAGLVAVPVNARLHRDEIAYILEHSESAVVVTDDDHAGDVESLVGAVASPRRKGPLNCGRPRTCRRVVGTVPPNAEGLTPFGTSGAGHPAREESVTRARRLLGSRGPSGPRTRSSRPARMDPRPSFPWLVRAGDS